MDYKNRKYIESNIPLDRYLRDQNILHVLAYPQLDKSES